VTHSISDDRLKHGALPFPISSARDAYGRGDFALVLTELDSVTAPSPTAEARLLRARALLRLRRPEEVAPTLAPLLTGDDVDVVCTARMLHASAIARLPDSALRGAKLLDTLAEVALRRRAHTSVRAEIEYYRGLARWSLYDLAAADRHAAIAADAPLDILSVRALELRAFVATARAGEPNADAATCYAQALALFERARRAYATCRGRDVDLATQLLLQISSLEQTLRCASIPGTHRIAGARAVPGTSFGPAVASGTRIMMLSNDAWLYALDGDHTLAFRTIRDAEHIAQTTSPAWHVWALATRATIAAAFGELASARILADDAAALALSVDWNTTRDEERTGLLRLAEAFAGVNAFSARAALTRYETIATPMDTTRVLRDGTRDPRLAGWHAYVRGLVLRNAGDVHAAADSLAAAADLFRLSGYHWREAQALIELGLTTTSVQTHFRFALDEAAAIVMRHFPRSFLLRRFGPWARAFVDPLVGKLTPAQRDILRQLLEGRTMREIAADTGRSYKTIRTHVHALHQAFQTQREHQLLAECGRRGIGAPSWAAIQNHAVALHNSAATA
jgi:DNA-binding NarL/FixJ family response regulator